MSSFSLRTTPNGFPLCNSSQHAPWVPCETGGTSVSCPDQIQHHRPGLAIQDRYFPIRPDSVTAPGGVSQGNPVGLTSLRSRSKPNIFI